jgi:hemerythrin-like metal-binding protein
MDERPKINIEEEASMPLVEWDDLFLVRLVELDQQHQQMIHLLNTLYEAVQQGKDKAAVDSIYDGLVDAVRANFATEEALFISRGYPEFREHKRQHDEFSKKISGFQQQFIPANTPSVPRPADICGTGWSYTSKAPTSNTPPSCAQKGCGSLFLLP